MQTGKNLKTAPLYLKQLDMTRNKDMKKKKMKMTKTINVHHYMAVFYKKQTD